LQLFLLKKKKRHISSSSSTTQKRNVAPLCGTYSITIEILVGNSFFFFGMKNLKKKKKKSVALGAAAARLADVQRCTAVVRCSLDRAVYIYVNLKRKKII
jgi:hypothetical protein